MRDTTTLRELADDEVGDPIAVATLLLDVTRPDCHRPSRELDASPSSSDSDDIATRLETLCAKRSSDRSR